MRARHRRIAPALVAAALALTLATSARSQALETVTPEEIHALVAGNAGDVVVVNFWATWCPPCLREFPDIIEVYNDYRDQGLTVLAVSMNEAEDAEDIAGFLANFAPPFSIYRAASTDTEFYAGVVDPWYGEMPMTLIFDTEGALVHVHKKPLTYDELATDVAAIMRGI
jgi:thiol-disulfide isomerase/thioredoxin